MIWVLLGLLPLAFVIVCEVMKDNKKMKELEERYNYATTKIHKMHLCYDCEPLGLEKKGYWFFSDKENFNIVNGEDGEITQRITLDDVVGYERISEIEKKQISLGKAVVGGVLFGGAGAVLGGLMGKEKVKKDEIILLVNHKGEEVVLVVSGMAMSKLEEVLPNKKVRQSQAIPTALRSNKPPKVDIYVELEKLSDLKEKGIITEEEFNSKKKQILGL